MKKRNGDVKERRNERKENGQLLYERIANVKEGFQRSILISDGEGLAARMDQQRAHTVGRLFIPLDQRGWPC